jgi:hypothetical protein
MPRTLIPLLCMFCVCFFAVSPASAGLGLSGSRLEKTVDPGQHIVHEMIVSTDEADPPFDIEVEVLGYVQGLDGSNDGVEPELDASPYSARSFFKVTPSEFHLEPGEYQKVILEGDIPDDVGDGGIYAFVDFNTLPFGEGQIGVVLSVGVPVRLTIAGTELIHTGEITSLDVDKLASDEEQMITLTLKNTGNHHYTASAETLIKGEDDEIIAESSIPAGFFPIIPTFERQFNMYFDLDEALEPGTYSVEATVRLEDGTVVATKEAEFEV